MKRNLLSNLVAASIVILTGCTRTPDFQLLPGDQNFQYQSTDSSDSDWFSKLSPELQSYYAEAKGKTGRELFDALHTIISRNNKIISYMDSKSFMYSTLDNITANNRTGVLDAYSEIFVPGSGGDGGKYIEPGDANKDGSPGDFINCEHTWPQSFFGKSLPMVGDLNHLQSTLAVPNRMRSDFPFGTVTGEITYTTIGGSKLGVSSLTGERLNITGIKKSLLANQSKTHKSDIVTQDLDAVFEPGDQQKGNTARAMLYFYLRYYDMGIRQGSFEKNKFWVSKVPTFIKWTETIDPVNDVDTRRNEIIFKKQNNRNPFVDIPNLASIIGETVLESK
jgi:endonuclease I